MNELTITSALFSTDPLDKKAKYETVTYAALMEAYVTSLLRLTLMMQSTTHFCCNGHLFEVEFGGITQIQV